MGRILGKQMLGQILQLLHISRVIIGHHKFIQTVGEDVCSLKVRIAEQVLEKMIQKQRDVLAPVPQGDGFYGGSAQQIEKLLPEKATLHLLIQVRRSCGDYPDIVMPWQEDGGIGAALEHMNQKILQCQGEILNIVHQKGTVVGSFQDLLGAASGERKHLV